MKRAFEKIVVAVIVFTLISTGYHGVECASAKEKEERVDVYYLDDLRELVGRQRIYDDKLEKDIVNEAGKLELKDDQKTAVIALAGDIEEASETEKARDKRARELVAELQEELAAGYYPTIVLATYAQAKEAIEAYESTFGTYIGSDKTREEEKEAFDTKIEALKAAKNSNPEIGGTLCKQMPVADGYVAATYETFGGATIFAAYNEDRGVYAMFDCNITDIKKSDSGVGYSITMETGDSLKIVYDCDITVMSTITDALSKNVSFSVRQGDCIGGFNSGAYTVTVSAELDDAVVDVLRLLGETGATLKQNYIAANPDMSELESLWEAINNGEMLSNIKPGTNKNKSEKSYTSKSSIDTYFRDGSDHNTKDDGVDGVVIG